MGKRKVTNADDMLPVQQAEAVVTLDVVHEVIRPDLKPLIDEAISRVRGIDQVGHMYYVRQRVEEALVLLNKIRDSA